ncbi:MAG: phosphoribosylformylglycinamidine cyclo-ligase [Candidatus Cloacimonetes bacterium]|nr:phosphoribosylformylglycinamidine cyclo-ligase [Candidatus Cloacimonadota bacterium]
MDYKTSGVDIEAGERAVNLIKGYARSTFNDMVLSDLGSFGGLYQIDLARYQEPVLVASTDGVGTKLRIAIESGVLDTIGQDLVNHCVNDILVQGAHPLFFLDYVGIGRMEPEKVATIIKGMADACRHNSCALLGGEMAEMPGLYQAGDFDLVGTIVGMVDKRHILPGNRVTAGDVLMGLPSTGLHTNGYSLARRIIFDKLKLKAQDYIYDLSCTVAEALLTIHKSYLNDLSPYLTDPRLHALAHITGGGIAGNLIRVLDPGQAAICKEDPADRPALFQWLKANGGLSDEEMRRTFNLGIGMITVIDPSLAGVLHRRCRAFVLGYIEPSINEVKQVIFK